MGSNLDNFRVYITSKRAIELNRRGVKSGISTKDARTAIKEIENVKFKEAFKDLQKYQDATLQYLKDSEVYQEIGAILDEAVLDEEYELLDEDLEDEFEEDFELDEDIKLDEEDESKEESS